MARNKVRNTDHSYLRAAQRCGWGKRKARGMMQQASRFGISAGNMAPGPERDFLEKKQWGSPTKRIKFYQGYIFVFCSTSTRCITVYPYEEENKLC